jgi:hypothetical protein
MSRLLALFDVVGSLFISVFNISGAAGVTEIPLSVRSVVYDSFSDKLYASGTNNLLQLDPLTGKVLNSFFLGTNVTLLSLGAEHGIWVAIDGEQSVCRFDLTTFTAEDKILVSTPGRGIFDLYGSLTDPTLALVSLRPVLGRSIAFVIRNGSVLPDAKLDIDYLAVQGASAYLGLGTGLSRAPLNPTGFGDHLTFSPNTPGGRGRPNPFGPYVYTQTGTVLDTTSLEIVTELRAPGFITIDRAENTVYYLTPGIANPVLSVFSHPSLQKINSVELTGILNSAGILSFAAYRRHVAFNIGSTLYIIDLDQFVASTPTANLEITQHAPESFEFGGGSLTFTVTITNRGPGAANLTLTDTISSGSAEIYIAAPQNFSTAFSAASPLVHPLGTVQPGQVISYTVYVRLGVPGPFTNSVLLTTTNALPAQTASMQTINVTVPVGPILAIRDISARDLGYDSRSGKLFANSSLNATWVIDPQAPAILPFLPVIGVGAIDAPTSGGALFVLVPGGPNGDRNPHLERIDTEDFTVAKYPLGGSVIDILAAPIDTHLVAVVNTAGIDLIRDGFGPPGTTVTGPAQFSADGTKLYVVNAVDCVLNIFNVDQTKLTLAQTRTNAGCSAFTEADGLLYFDGGVVYDPVADKRSTIGLPPPVQMLARGNQVVDTLSRSNGIWTLRRLAGADHHVVRSVPLNVIGPSDGIALFKPAGSDRVAITSGSTLYIVNLGAPSQLSVEVSLRDPATVLLRVDSTADAVYRIETESTPGASNWTTVEDNIGGTGGIIERSIPIQAQQNAFFRAVRLPQ